jgi:hypothetical protein
MTISLALLAPQPCKVGIERLRDLPTGSSRQFKALGIKTHQLTANTRTTPPWDMFFSRRLLLLVLGST